MRNLRKLLWNRPEILLWLANVFIWYTVFMLLLIK